MKFSTLVVLFVSLFLSLRALASAQLTKILDKYSKASTIEIQIKKTDEKNTIGTKTTSEGVLKYANGKIYLLLNSDKKTEFFYKDKKITLVEYPDQDFDKEGARKVTKLTKNKPALIGGILDLFSNSKNFFKEFKIVSEKADKNKLTVNLAPAQKNIKNMSLIVNTKEKIIESIIFTDDVDTKTTLELSKLKLNRKISASTFEFKSLKSDEVIPE